MGEAFQVVKQKWAILLLIIFLVLFGFWCDINFGALASDANNQIWAASYQILAFIGGIVGIFYSRLWGGYKSYVGRGVLFLAIGLLFQCFGQSVYSYFIFYQHITIPYPSLGDVGFFGSVIMYIGATTQIARACGVTLKASFSKKINIFILPVILLVISYFIFLKGYVFDWSNPVKIFLDFGYPLGEAIYVSIALMAILLSRQLLGGIMKKPLMFMIVAFLFQYASDFTFLYQSNNGTWRAGGVNDLMYSISYLLMSLSIVYMGKTFFRIQEA